MTFSVPHTAVQGPIHTLADWPADATRDRIVGPWHHYQRRRGHRASTDDVLTSALARIMTRARGVARYLDLGCGVGSVLLTTTFAVQPEQAVGVEAQAQSALLLQRSIRELPRNAPPIALLLGDFRSVSPDTLGRFDLITGSPPYLPLGTGILPSDPQRAACRFELRGGIEAYLETAARMLADDGDCAMVFQTTWRDRVIAAGSAAGLYLTDELEVVMREGGAPFLGVYGFRRNGRELIRRTFAIRRADGSHSHEYLSLREELGIETPR